MKLRLNIATTLVLLVAIAVLGAWYMSVGVLHMGTVQKTTHITLLLKRSGGLLPTSEVTMRGIRVGRVSGVRTTAAGLTVTLELENGQHVPQGSTVGVESLSAVGEQYIDFKPPKIAPPYFEDGAVIPADQVAYHATVSEMLERGSALVTAIDPQELQTIVQNVATAFSGNEKIFDQLATDATVFARTLQENKPVLAMLLGNLEFIMAKGGQLHADSVLTGLGKDFSPAVLKSLEGLFQQLHYLRDYAIKNSTFSPDNTLETLVAKIGEYLDLLSGPMSTFGPALENATAPLYNDRIDVGGWIGEWGSAMEDNGGIRVRVHVRGHPQPDDRSQPEEDQPQS